MGAAGKSLAFLPARCFLGLFGVCLCASCSIDCGLFCGVGGRRFVAGVGWFGLGRWRVCVGLGGGCRGNATVMCGGCAWCSVSFGDSLWRFGVGLVVSSISSSSPHMVLVGTVGLRGVEVACRVFRFLIALGPGIPSYWLGLWSFFVQGPDSLEMACL